MAWKPPPTERLPRRGVLGRGDDRPGLVGVHDHRRDDAHRAAVEDHLDPLVLAGGDAGQRDAARVGDGAEHQGGGLDVGVGVLHVHGQPGETRSRHEPRRGDAPQRQPGADLRLARLQARITGFFFNVVPPVRNREWSLDPVNRVSHEPKRGKDRRALPRARRGQTTGSFQGSR